MKYVVIRTKQTVLFVALFILCFTVERASAQQSAVRMSRSPKVGQTVIMGTWSWDIESNKQVRSIAVDLWWEQIDAASQRLVALGGTRLALLETKEYESVSLEDISRTKLTARGFDGDSLEVGAVFAMRTTEGNFAKFRIIGFRSSHDSSLKEKEFARPGWVAGLLSRPDNPKYHLEIEWTLYPVAKEAF